MAYSPDSKVGEILKEKAGARNVVLKYGVGIMLLQPQTHELSLGQIRHHLRWPEEKFNSLLAELNAL